LIALIGETCVAGARQAKTCQAVGLSPRTVQRWQRSETIPSDGRKAASHNRVPANKLSATERAEVLATANQAEFAHLPPSQIVPKLADEGRYLAAESTFYRILRDDKQLAHRGRAKAATRKRPEAFQATAPNQLWSWDITYCAPRLGISRGSYSWNAYRSLV
jgi:transposase InsO family protein